MPRRDDPDDLLSVIFKLQAFKNPEASLAAGREIHDDREVCEIRAPGMKDVKVFYANLFSRWVVNPETGEQEQQSYAERFSHQYRQFKARDAQTKRGTPLNLAPFLSDGRRAELRAQNIYTVEQLAALEGTELKNIGPGGREMKNSAQAFIEESAKTVPTLKMMEELEALKARNAVLEEDTKRLKELAAADGSGGFDSMNDEALSAFIKTNTGHAPVGAVSRKTLLRMAAACQPDKVA